MKKYLTILLASLISSSMSCSQKNDGMSPTSAETRTHATSVLDSVSVSPFSVLQYWVNIRCSDTQTKGYSFIKFFDSTKKELLVYQTGPVSSVTFQGTGNYTEAPPYTRYAVIGIVKDSVSAGEIYADSFKIELNVGTPLVKHEAACNLYEYMKPFWNSDTIYNETVLMYSEAGKSATGKLLFVPDQIISVQSFDLLKVYNAANDYTVQSNIITRSASSTMPFRTDRSFDQKDLAWYNLQSQWVVVTYIHHDKWAGPMPSFKGNQLPHLLQKLTNKMPVKIIGYGMSITRGLNISSYDNVPPYMPTYLELFSTGLKSHYGYENIEMYNAGLPGALVSWGADYADKYINPLQPDLVIIDFGMNDFWRYTPNEFRNYIQTIISKVKATNPETEFLLLSNMDFDPAYILDSDPNKTFYLNNMHGYAKVLAAMETTGIVNLDMTTLSNAIYAAKKAKDCISNPLHPNDYLARWYAQGLTALISQ